jgi:hypothetical protein
MKRLTVVALGVSALALVGCATKSTVRTEPAGLSVALNGKDFGKSPVKVESTGTTFGDYRLQVKDGAGKVLHEQNLPKAVRIWGIFWPPYGVFYNLYELHDEYTVRAIKSASGETTWVVLPSP